MLQRLKSGIWVAAHIRRLAVEGVVAVVARRGAEEAGAIYVKVVRPDRTADLFGPAPQTAFDPDDERAFGRLFERLAEAAPEAEIDARLARETRFDPDLWILEIEDRAGRHFLDLQRPPPPAWPPAP